MWLPETTKLPETVISFAKTPSVTLIFCNTFKLALIVLLPFIVTFCNVDWLFRALKLLLIVKSFIVELP